MKEDAAFALADALSEIITAPTHDLDILRQALRKEPDLRSFELQARQALGANFNPDAWDEARDEAIRLLRERTLDSMIALCEEELEEIAAEREDEDLERIAAQTEHIPRRSESDDRAPMTPSERKLAAMLLNEIPPDVWDACVAAIECDNEDGERTAREIFDRWRKEH